ncbi:MAG: TIGR01459 family HAD-type hydrolase [Alphaproteobacteria bacterium]|nr:TIGR01459 family HAD-type hydrolase [Alphaproteobacteria bacterium]
MNYFAGIRDIYTQYDAFLIDIWGVLHDGRTAYPGAIDAIRNLHQAGKAVILLSNAPRPSFEVYPVLKQLGFVPEFIDAVQTSGQEVWENLRDRTDPWYQNLGQNIYLLGPMKDSAMVVDIQGVKVEHIEKADVVLATGLEPHETLADYEEVLHSAKRRNLPMICANPDIIVIHDGIEQLCAGALAARYQELGGEVRYHGKPHLSIYQSAFRQAQSAIIKRGLLAPTISNNDDSRRKNVSRETIAPLERPILTSASAFASGLRIAALGDGLATDITGANQANIDGYFILGGIHASDFVAHGFDRDSGKLPPLHVVQEFCQARAAIPSGILRHFAW